MDEPRAPHRAPAGSRGSRGPAWRLATPAVFIAAGVLLVTSAVTSRGTDLRPGRYDSLADLAQEESHRVSSLRDQVTSLQDDVDALSAGLDSDALQRLQRRVDALAGPAGLTAV